MIDNPEPFMKEALRQARLACRSGEVPVGALVVRGGQVIGRGRNRPISACDPTAHAEVAALRRAARLTGNYRLTGAELFVTLEPCLMCYAAMVHARVDRLWYGAPDPKGGVFSTGAFGRIQGIFNHRIEVVSGVLAEPASRLLKEFFQARRGARAVEWDGLENRCGG